MLLVLSSFSLSWKRHPSYHPDGHPVIGFTNVYVPSGQDTKSVRKKNYFTSCLMMATRNKINVKNKQIPALAKAMKHSRKQAQNFVIVNLKKLKIKNNNIIMTILPYRTCNNKCSLKL